IPQNEIEIKLINLWEDLLDISGIGIDYNFFNLGGQSLKATVLVSRIKQSLGVEVPLREIFNRPTVKGLAEYISGKEKTVFKSIVKCEKKDYYPLSSSQLRIYIVNRLSPE